MAKKESKSNKEKKQKHFFKDFKAEIKKVIWPTPKQLVNSTVAVITMVLVVAAIVFVLDVVFEAFNKYALTNLQKVVQTVDDESTINSTDQLVDDSIDVTTEDEEIVENENDNQETQNQEENVEAKE